MDPLEKNVTYFVVGKQVRTSESSSLLDREFPYPKARKKISAEEIKGAVPISEAILFRTRKEAERYVSLTAKAIGIGDKMHTQEAPIFEVQLRNSIHKPQIVTENIERELGKSESVQYTNVNPENLRYISGGVPGIPGKYQFKPTDEANIKTPKEWLDKIGFESKIQALQNKVARLENKDIKAANELKGILENLRANKEEFVEGRKNAQQFVNACADAIKPENTKALANHRGLFASIKSFVESIVQLVNPKFKINSDSINKIKDVEKSLGEIKPEQVVHETDIAKRTLKSDYEVDSENKVAKTGQGGPSTKPG